MKELQQSVYDDNADGCSGVGNGVGNGNGLSGGGGGVCGSVSVGGVAAAFRRLGVFVVVVVAGYFVWLRFSEGATDEEST